MDFIKTIGAASALLLATSTFALGQSTGASPADPNNERNQRPAMGNSQPSDPATDDPAARVPTDPQDAASAEREEGGATGESSGEAGADTVIMPDEPAAAAPDAEELPENPDAP